MRRVQTVTADQQARDWKLQQAESKIQSTSGNFLMTCTEAPKRLKIIHSNLSSGTQSLKKMKMAKVATAADTKILSKENSLTIPCNLDWLFMHTVLN